MGATLPPAGSVVVIGHSSGAVGALKIAVAHPDRVDAVVLTSGFFPTARGGRTTAATIADYARHRASFVRDVARRKRAPRPTRRGGRELAALARLGIRPDGFHTIAANVRCPVLIIHGDADHVVPVACARAALTRWRSRIGSRPIFIFTHRQPSSLTQPPSCLASLASE